MRTGCQWHLNVVRRRPLPGCRSLLSREKVVSRVGKTMAVPSQPEAVRARGFLIDPRVELAGEIVKQRRKHVNAILRLATLTGSQMQLEPSLNLLCDISAEIVPYSVARVYFWNEAEETMELRVNRGARPRMPNGNERGGTLNFWAGQFAKPLLVTAGSDLLADAELASAN